MIPSPVGMQCRDCAREMRSPIYTVSGGALWRSIAVALVGGVVMGLIWGFVLLPFTFGFLSIFLGAGLGFAFTRMLEWASGRKRGPVMIVLAMMGISIAWGMTLLIIPIRIALYGLVAVGIGIYFSYQNLK
jgi:hypothetical protein